MTQRIFVDANVLYSRTLRDWLFLLRIETGAMFQVHSTEDVLIETLYNLRRKHPDWDGGQISRLRMRLVESLDELIDEFDGSIPYKGDDPNDRHVHAAAVASSADILLTADAGFFALADGDTLPYSVYGCDDFFLLIDDSASAMVQRATDNQRRYWASRHDGTSVGLSDALRAAGCPSFASRVTEHLRTLSGPTARVGAYRNR